MGAYLLWKHRNSCVFEGANPCLAELLRNFRDEQHLWSMAGAQRLASLSAGQADRVG
ncbi:hypothetical protein PR202_gb17053 [Eleusine coracana subsp. coracana]|uniref:Uncharacterized protein n=1 Tax=Eleusine coracana subsp. coracana TaxID=191504 RepID=A0AAV5F204_ELECO|nr:hypothetical protein PR202_gb17053 [Eleusine coracana subsp. coracana]